MTNETGIKKPKLWVIVDSNALFAPLEFRIDIFAELERVLNRNFELVLISPVKKELEMLSQKKSVKTQKYATFALSLAARCTYVEVKQKRGEQTDESILRIAKKWGAPVFTNDKQLKGMLRDISLPVIYVRAKSRLDIDGMT
ncbi:MAG: DNA-binding protein [Candidatus Bathyarchaeota archaeon]|nr:DNA-binding protein [Candidatus Bathyarchaeota archaeon]